MTDKHIVNIYERAKAAITANRVVSGERSADGDSVLVSFNKWHAERFGWVDHRHADCANRWQAWQASREALAIELPMDIKTMAGPVMYADDVRAAVEAAGLKVKP